MPSRNAVKQYVVGGRYHVYNRGHNKQPLYRTDQDYAVFLNHLKRHLSRDPVHDRKGRPYEKLFEEVELIAFCLMPNHFHLLVQQKTEDGMPRLLKRACNSYSNYYNHQYGMIGSLFQGRYKAVLIDSDEYACRVLQYIHRNPEGIVRDYRNYQYSSIAAYEGRWKADWLHVRNLDK